MQLRKDVFTMATVDLDLDNLTHAYFGNIIFCFAKVVVCFGVHEVRRDLS